MQVIGDIFNDIQENNNVPNKAVFALIEQFQKNQTQFINGLAQCFLKIMKSMASLKSVLKRQYEIYEKLTEKLFSTLHTNYIKKPAERGESIEKEEILSKLFFIFVFNGFFFGRNGIPFNFINLF